MDYHHSTLNVTKRKLYLICGAKYKCLVPSREDLLNDTVLKSICQKKKFQFVIRFSVVALFRSLLILQGTLHKGFLSVLTVCREDAFPPSSLPRTVSSSVKNKYTKECPYPPANSIMPLAWILKWALL